MDENKTADAEPRIINVEAPYFEDLKVGQLFSDAPDVMPPEWRSSRFT
jgi:hypothetical protein